jgi:hypothetical protein
VLEEKLAALQRKLKEAASAEASRRAADERRAADARRLGDDIQRMKAARVELVRCPRGLEGKGRRARARQPVALC